MDIHSLTEVEPELEQNLTVVDTEMETSEKQHNLTAKPERTKSELQSVFDFETSDSAEKSQVSESKRKFLGRRSSQTDEKQNVKVAKASKKRSRGEKVTHKRSDMKKLFTEDSCSEGSEHSWLSVSQTKVLPRVADYSKQKKKKSSVLRVLPLSLESSEGEEQKGEVTPSKGFQITSEEHDIPLSEQVSPEFSDIQASVVPKVKRIKTADVSVGTSLELLTPPDTLQKITSPVIKIPRGTSTKKIPANEGTPGDVGQQSANPPLTRYYNDTTNMDEELEGMEQLAERSHEMEDGYLSDGNISAALHGFTEGMRQKLRLCYRNMEQYTRQSRQSTEKFSVLMRQIHTYRLQKLSMFESIIDKDLKNLEEDVQTLQNLEEDFNRWKQQSLKLSQFYEKWQQRMNMLMSSTEDKPEISK
ncbi:synaptonemal complex protein 2-like [Pristis pectinata]|uniref:synaptonemal complex protein 2-like n=1 Tax=Pristis pectinata TaxID=685728 RepID=UPI00223D7770|nr:synaptonemal complex protein 2-like [Pristis pectinata]